MEADLELWLDATLGLESVPGELSIGQMVVRALLVYAVGILLVRIGAKRFAGRNGAFDLVLGIILGSILSRAITGNSAFLPTLAAATVLVICHRASAAAACRSGRIDILVKGRSRELASGGRIDASALRRSHTSVADLEIACRKCGVPDLDRVDRIFLERDGSYSVLERRGRAPSGGGTGPAPEPARSGPANDGDPS